MPRYDPDLIAALAEGRLDPEEAARLEREIAGDPNAADALEAQRTAIAALSAAATPLLTELERAGLRASIADALGLADPEPVAAAAPRQVPWGSLGIATAALIGLVAIVPVVGLLNTGGGDDAATAIELAPDASTTSRTGSSTSDLDAGDDAGGEAAPEAAVTGDGSFGDDDTPGNTFLGFGSTTVPARTTTPEPEDTTTTPPTSTPAEEATSTTVAKTTTTATTASAGGSTTTTSAPEEGSLEALVADLTDIWEDAYAVEAASSAADSTASCWDEDTVFRGGEPDRRFTFEYDNGADWLVAIFFLYDADGSHGPFQVYELPDCETLTEVP